MIDAERTGLAAYVARRRLELGLSPNGLAQRTLTFSSNTIRDIESGFQQTLRPRPARSLARALELDDLEADRLYHLAGCATAIDWRSLAEEILAPLGLAHELHERARKAYAQQRPIPPTARRRRPPSATPA